MAQDDVREREMRTVFNLVKPSEAGRAGIDAVLPLRSPPAPLELDGTEILFELKSATTKTRSISTVRDFGLHHVEKWRRLHWIFGVYEINSGEVELQYCLYGSPAKMKAWFDRMALYIATDVALAEHVPALITPEVLREVLGGSGPFSLPEAKRLMKNQYKAADYRSSSDLADDHFSEDAMVKMLRERCEYVIRRGSTLNNPHIPASYFDGWERITENHAARLRELVLEAIEEETTDAN